MKARREQEKEKMRSIIIDEAIKIIMTEGYEKLSMRKLAQRIDYSPTTIYNYYKDKESIVNDIVKWMYTKIVTNVKNAVAENPELAVEAKLKLTMEVFVNTMTSNAEMGRAVMRSGTSAIFGTQEEEDPEEDGMLLLQSLLLEGQDKRILRRLDQNIPWMLITSLLGFSLNAIDNQLYLQEEWPQLLAAYISLLMQGILQN